MPLQGERFDRASDGEAYRPESRALDPRTIIIQPGWNVRDVTTTEALDLADAMCRLILDPKISRDELKLAAEAYREAREK
jgi:hypothetical protein